MTLLNFGQPAAGIMQMSYVVEDLHDAIGHWIRQLNVGPWFLLEHFTGIDPVYRGRKSTADVALAMSFAGHLNIELIQPNDDRPSVYREHIARHGHGFHHWGVACADFETALRTREAQGMELVFRCGVPTGGEVAYLDPHGVLPGYVELIQTGPQMERAFGRFYAAALNWDGAEPIRSFL